MVIEIPGLTDVDREACARIEAARRELDRAPIREWTQHLWAPRLWRLMFHHATAPSNARALVPGIHALPLHAAEEARAADAAYRRAMTLALRVADDPEFAYSVEGIRLLHRTLYDYDSAKEPGRLRRVPVAIRHEVTGEVRRTTPEPSALPALMESFVNELNARERSADVPGVVLAAVASLVFVSVHPFVDGNGRMSRCLQTLILARSGMRSATFCSLDHYFGTYTQLYNNVIGAAQESPTHDTRPWVSLCLRAHLWQIAALRRTVCGLERLDRALNDDMASSGLSASVMPLLLDAALGKPVQVLDAASPSDVCRLLAGSHLEKAAAAGLLVARGHARELAYYASARLAKMAQEALDVTVQSDDPYEGTETDTLFQSLTTSDAEFWKL